METQVFGTIHVWMFEMYRQWNLNYINLYVRTLMYVEHSMYMFIKFEL